MRKSILSSIAIGGVLAACPAFANTYAPSTVSVTAVSGVTDSGGDNIGPYTGTFGGVSTTALFCDDLAHNIQITAATTNVNVSDITDLSLTRFGGSGAATKLTALVSYEKIFYLSTFLGGSYTAPGTFYTGKIATDTSANTSVNADIQDAIWSIFDPATPNTASTAVGYWLGQASSNYANYNYSSYRILTDNSAPSATTGQYNGVQELFINTIPGNPLKPTPEPGTLAMLFSGLAAVGVGIRRRRSVAL